MNVRVRVAQGDPVLALVYRRTWLGACAACALTLFNALVLIVGPRFAGAPLGPAGTVVALQYAFCLVPLSLWVYLAFPSLIEALFGRLAASGALKDPQTGDLAANVRRWLHSPLLTVAAIAAVIGYWLYRPIWSIPGAVDLTEPIDPAALGPLRLWLILSLSPALYAGILAIMRLVIGLVFAWLLFQNCRLELNPLDEDGSAGLAPVGELFTFTMVVSTILGFIALGMSLALLAVGISPFSFLETYGLFLLYAALLPTSVVVLLWLPHRVMLRARARFLQPLRDELARTLAQMGRVQAGGLDELKVGNEYVAELRRRYDLVEGMIPTWPLRLPVIRGLSISALIPLATALANFLLHPATKPPSA